MIDKVANVEAASLYGYGKILEHMPEAFRHNSQPRQKLQITWRLKAI